MHHPKKYPQWPQVSTWLSGLAYCFMLTVPVAAQITPAPDATGTIVNLNGNEFSIEGGFLSGDSTNLFHSFQQFGLDAGQIANFLITQPNLENILGRVTGGDPSLINGLLKVSGGDANLYLMNPAGIVFGADTSLNVPGDFTATTATGIKFGDQWFNATGSNSYVDLNGSPTGFQLGNSGVVLNSGDLSVGPGNRLLLLGSTVTNVGELTAPEGQILIVAHPGENVLSLRFPGYMLGLEIAVEDNPVTQPTAWTLPIATLPELLRLDGVSSISPDLTVTTDDSIQLANSDTRFPVQSGTAIIGGILDVSGQQGGDIGVLADRIGLAANVNANGTTAGGTVLVGGDYRGQGDLPTASRTVVTAESVISADATHSGDGGRVIIWADDTTGFFGSISARGGLTLGDGGFVEVSGKKSLLFRGTADVGSTVGNVGTLLLDPENIIIVDGAGGADDDQIADSIILSGDSPNNTFTISETTLEGLGATGNVLLEATSDITIQPLTDTQLTFPFGTGQISFVADADADGNGAFTMRQTDAIVAPTAGGQQDGRTLSISGASITVGNISTRSGTPAGGAPGGSVVLTAIGDITTANIEALADNAPANIRNGGNITIISQNGSIDTSAGILAAGGASAIRTGDVRLEAPNGNITTSQVGTGAVRGDALVTGSVTLIAGGTIDTSRTASIPGFLPGTVGSTGIQTFTQGDSAGNISIEAGGDVTLSSVSSGASNNGGDIEITSQQGNITLERAFLSPDNFDLLNPNAFGGTNGSLNLAAGSLTLNAPNGDISVSSIDAQGGQVGGVGGNVTIIANNFVQITDTFTDQNGINASISATGGAGNGVITISHGGGSQATPFIVGDASTNGTAGVLTTGANNSILPTQSFLGPYSQGDISLITTETLDQETSEFSPSQEIAIPEENPFWLDEYFSRRTEEYLQYVEPSRVKSLEEIQEDLRKIHNRTGVKPALIYAIYEPQGIQLGPDRINLDDVAYRGSILGLKSTDDDPIVLVLVTSDERPIVRRTTAIRSSTKEKVIDFLEHILPNSDQEYLEDAHQIYDWLLDPLEKDLSRLKIENLVYIMDDGLRSVPLAAMYDGNKFIIEKYSVGLMPSFSLTNTTYQNIRRSEMWALGTSKFAAYTSSLKDLPAVPDELEITTRIWNSEKKSSRNIYLDERFTRDNLQPDTIDKPGILHLATHAEAGTSSSPSYIQLWQDRLSPISQLRELPNMELLVLSACETALDDEQVDAALGFAGLAVQAGSKSVLASLWQVEDYQTLVLMSAFYNLLKQDYTSNNDHMTKAEALREAQWAMLEGRAKIQDGKLVLTSRQGVIRDFILSQDLKQSLTNNFRNKDANFSHPYYWSGFTVVGSPY